VNQIGGLDKTMNKLKVMLIFLLLFFGMLLFINSIGATDIIVDFNGGGDYTNIQDAVNASSDGDTIYVWNGTYVENVVVNKSISIIGNCTSNTTVVSPGSSPDGVFKIENDSVNISYLNITGVTTSGHEGIYGANINFINISNCVIYNCDDGIYLYNMENITVSNNNISDCDNGVYIDTVDNITISNNNITFCPSNGVYVEDTSVFTFEDNTMMNCDVYGMFLDDVDNVTISNNYFYNNTVEFYPDVFKEDFLIDNNTFDCGWK